MLLAKKINSREIPQDIFLNVNLPELPLAEIIGVKHTQPAHNTHLDSVDEGHNDQCEYYWLVRHRLKNDVAENTDMWALEQGFVSITSLNTTPFHKPVPGIDDSLCYQLFQQLKQF